MWESRDCPRFGERGFFRGFWGCFSKVIFAILQPSLQLALCVCQRQIPDFHEQLFLQKLLLELSCRSVDEKRIAFPLRNMRMFVNSSPLGARCTRGRDEK